MADDVLLWDVDSEEFIHFDVTADVDPLADSVSVALVPKGTSRTADDFADAEWVPGQTWTAGETVRCRRLLPAGTLEDRVTYKASVKIGDDPETPIMSAGFVRGQI